MEKIWFIFSENFVSGPFTTETVESKMAEGKITKKAKIWWKGQRDWIELENWKQNVNEYQEGLNKKEEAVWYALKDGHTLGPNTKSQLIQILSNLENLTKIRVWKKGQEKWATVYQYTDISDQLGIKKRQHPRAPVIGEVVITKENKEKSYTAATISAGGIGLTGDVHLTEGDEVSLTLRSPLLVIAISGKAVVRHITQKYCGLEFTSINNETKSLLVDYVKQFEGPSTQFLKNVS